MSTLVVRGGGRLGGRPAVPGDKSLSHRALILGAMADGPTRVANLSPCGDVARTVEALRRLGVQIDGAPELEVHGRGVSGLGGPPVEIDCGESGTTMRLLAGALVGQDREFVLDGSAALRRRPMRRVTAPLRQMAGRIEDSDGYPPLTGRGGPLTAAEVNLPRASAQVGSAVLLAALNARGTTVVRYPRTVRDHTERMLAAFGAPISWTPLESRLHGPVDRLGAPRRPIPIAGDISAASNLIAAAIVVPGSAVEFRGLCGNPGRMGFIEILQGMGADLRLTHGLDVYGEPTVDVRVRAGCLTGIDIDGDLVPRSVDELPLVAVLACAARGVTSVHDAEELRLKESDRVAAIVDGLRRMGARVQERADGFAVWGPSSLVGGAVDGCGDHRIVMALTVAGLSASGETRISGAEAVSDSFPRFYDELSALGADVTLEA